MRHAFDPQWQAGLSYTRLQESQGFLGSVFSPGALLGLQGQGQSEALELATSVQLHPNHLLMAQFNVGTTADVQANGLLNGVSGLRTQGWGLGWLSHAVWNRNDQLSVVVKQPLRLSAGHTGLWQASVNDLGQAVYQLEKVGLVPEGRELDVKLAYDTPFSTQQTLSLQEIYRHDVQHVSGVNDFSVGGLWRMQF